MRKGPEPRRGKIQNIIKLYEERKVPKFKEALNAALLLSSTNKNTIKSNKPINEYNKLGSNYEHALPVTGMLSRPKEASFSIMRGDFSEVNAQTQIFIKEGYSLQKVFQAVKEKWSRSLPTHSTLKDH